MLTPFVLDNSIDNILVGLSLTQLLNCTNSLQIVARECQELANELIPIEKVLQYIRLEKEKQDNNLKYTKTTWPEEGGIIFKDLSLRYFPLEPFVLKNINLQIKPREKVV